MKTIILLTLLSIPLCANAQNAPSYVITGWHVENGVTYCKIEMDFAWVTFQLRGEHTGDISIMLSEGCALNQRWGLYYFHEVPGLRYVKKGDGEKLKTALGLERLCNE